jgi:ABC-type polar amino acid transport system ATPase subunit
MAPIIRVRGLEKCFGNLYVLRGLDLDVEVGEVLVVIGRSGSGKSTFLRCLNFLEEPTAGTVEIDDVVIPAGEPSREHRLHIQQIRAKTGMVFQHFNLFPHMTALENAIEGPLTVKGMPRKEVIEIGERLLGWVGLMDKRDEYPSRLSGGQQQRVAIARALAMEPKIMLFDEPTSALDPEMIKGVLDVMLDLAQEGMTMVVVSHEMGFVRAAADRVALLDEGSLVEVTTPEKLFSAPEKERTKEFLSHILH